MPGNQGNQADAFTDRMGLDLTGMRDKLIHDYFGVDLAAVWDTLVNNLPVLKEQLGSSG